MPAHRLLIVAIGCLTAGSIPALADPVGGARPKSWGDAEQTVLTLGPCDAVNREPEAPVSVVNCGFLTANVSDTFGSADAGFPVHLPHGALIEEVSFAYYDTIVGSEPEFNLRRIFPGGLSNILNTALPVWNQGNNIATFVVDPPHEIDNDNAVYALNLHMDTVDATHYQGLHNISIRYRLQVSPPPPTATFNDVPTGHPFFRFVEALAASGITAGCGGGNFCPDQALTRGQMAVFLSKALGLHFPN